MKMIDIKQEPHNSTLMSSVKAAYQYYYQEDISDAMLFGLSGHAFVTSVSKGIGPCAPYTWDMEQFNQLCNDSFGLNVIGREHPITPKSTIEEKKKASNLLKEMLDSNKPVLLTSYEFQLVTGYDENYFKTTIPWDAPSCTKDFEVDRFEGIKDFMLFSKIEKTEKKDLLHNIEQSIRFALSQYDHIDTKDFISQGIEAYDFWLEQMNEENYNKHGIWWNSLVWAESRELASKYMIELKKYIDQETVLNDLAKHFDISALLFKKLSDKSVSLEQKREDVQSLKQNELAMKPLLELLLVPKDDKHDME